MKKEHVSKGRRFGARSLKPTNFLGQIRLAADLTCDELGERMGLTGQSGWVRV